MPTDPNPPAGDSQDESSPQPAAPYEAPAVGDVDVEAGMVETVSGGPGTSGPQAPRNL